MFTTYLIENRIDGTVIEYYDKLCCAKIALRHLDSINNRILCLKGQYKYEGMHMYQIVYSGNVYLKEKLR